MAPGRFSNGTKVNMHHKEKRQDKSDDNMNQISKMDCAGAEDPDKRDNIREDEKPSGDKYQGHQEIENCDISDLLKRVEL